MAPKATEPAQTTPKILGKEPAKAALGNKGKGAIQTHNRRKVSSTTVYGNEWINYSQKYYKIKIAKNGLYRIDSTTLAKYGIPVGTINPKNYQLFFRGQQQYIYVRSKTANLSEVNGDYIEFYGQYNDGVPDSLVYYKIKYLPNPYYSLFNDTSTYYLTWNSSTTNFRLTEQTDTSWASGYPIPYVMTSTVNLENQWYFQGATIPEGIFIPNDPRFVQDVAWVGSPYNNTWVTDNSKIAFTPNLDSAYVYDGSVAPSAFMRTVLLGVNTGITPFTMSDNLRQLWINDTCKGFGAFDTSFTFPALDLKQSPFQFTYYNNASTTNS
ncbi:MAG TPA: hypothetical protein VK808_03665, partial [Bacteroidia bacterium]|nr:hypothetical protein [Bacteroidia bacterium]